MAAKKLEFDQMKRLFVLLCALPLSGCFDPSSGMCGNNAVQEIPSPNGQLKVVIFRRDCGATTGFSTQVSILPAQTVLNNEKGNVFITDTDHGAAPSKRGGGPNVRVKWLSSNTLKIIYDRRARTFIMEPHQQGVSVVYQTN